MYSKTFYFRKGHSVKNVPCDGFGKIPEDVKKELVLFYFRRLIYENKFVTIDYCEIK